jgi:hypothetical protein
MLHVCPIDNFTEEPLCEYEAGLEIIKTLLLTDRDVPPNRSLLTATVVWPSVP